MPILLDNPLEVGADRLVNAVAAYERFGGACVVVDFGTAINFDASPPRASTSAASIGPGVEISLDGADRARRANLPRSTSPSRASGGIGQLDAGEPPVRLRLRLRRR